MEDALVTLRYIIGGGMLAFGAFVGLGNWSSFIGAAFNKSSTSFVFVLGVAAMLAGLFLMPPNPLRTYWWGAFIIDFSAGPFWVLTVLSLIFSSDADENSS